MNHATLKPCSPRLANPNFRPGLIWLRLCLACDAPDRTSWYPSLAAASEASARASSAWRCLACGGGSWMPARRWFDTVYEQR